MWSTQQNKIDEILNNNLDRSSESVLNELFLNQEDFINEVKRCNYNVMNFFKDNQKVVLKLVEYISVESKNLTDIDRCFKFPLVSSELFDCSSPCIMAQFFVEQKEEDIKTDKMANLQTSKPYSGDQDDECRCDGDSSHEILIQDKHAQPTKNSSFNTSEDSARTGKRQKNFNWPVMNKLFEFLNPLTCINEVLAGYWSKVILSLISMRPQEMIEYLLTSTGVLDGLLRHINDSSIASVVSNLFILESNKFSISTQQFLNSFTEIKVKTIEQFIQKFNECSSEEVSNFVLIFSEIISKYYLIQDGKEMLGFICTEESINKLFNYMVSGNDGAKKGSSLIIQSLAQYYAFNSNSFIIGYPEGSEFYQIMLSQYENMPFFKNLVGYFDKFAEILSTKDNNQTGVSARERLGFHRLKIIEIMNNVIKIQFPSIQDGLVNNKIFQRILDLFFKFEWHNILHQSVLNILLFIIQNSEKNKIKAYLKYLLSDLKLTEQIITQVDDTQFYFDKIKYPTRSTTKGFLGYVIRISDALEKFFQISSNTRQNLDMLDWHNESWINFNEQTLGIHKEKSCQDLGNFDKYINGVIAPESAGGEDDLAIYREYERQQAAERMKQRSSYLEQVELCKIYKQKRAKQDSKSNTEAQKMKNPKLKSQSIQVQI